MFLHTALIGFSLFALGAPAPDRALLFRDLERRAGPEVWQELQDSESGARLLRELESDTAWLRDLLDSGPVRRADVVLRFLHRLWREDPGLARREVDRSMATACALAMGMTTLDADWMAKRYEYYRASHAAGLLNACYEGLDTWERRYLARGCQWKHFADAEALEFLRDRICWPRGDYVGACWQAPYRGFNCLGDSVQRSEYYMPFQGAYGSGPEMAIEVGGVCGALSNMGAAAAMASGIPAATMGEPGHCAYTVKVDDDTWQPAYSLSWQRGLHTSFHDATWPGLMLTEACYSNRAGVRRSGDLARKAHELEATDKLDKANSHWRRALSAHGLHYELWLEWAAFGERTGQDAKWWRGYHDALLEGLGDHEEPTWKLLKGRVYPKLLDGLDGARRRGLFLEWVRELDTWGGGRWDVESAWSELFGHLGEEDQARFVRAVTRRFAASPDFGPLWATWLIGRHDAGSERWNANLAELMRATRTGKAGADPILDHLARKALVDAAERGDVRTFQEIGEATARLSEALPMDGIEPFEGELVSDGGLLLVSGRGNRWDSPAHHWGVLGEHGGRCHTDNGASSISVRLECDAELSGLVIQNIAGGNLWRAGGSRVEISSDGESWEQVGTLEGTSAVYRVDLADAGHRASWVRIAKDSNCLHVRRFLVYGERRPE